MLTSVMNTTIYDKTEKGRDEIANRKYQLNPRLRTLLVMMDGHNSIEELLAKVGSLGLSEESFHELLANDFIALVGAPGAGAAKPAAKPLRPPAPFMPPAAAAPALIVDPAQQFKALYDFYNQTIKSTLGLRGFTLQLKTEKAGNISDFRDLRQQYVEAVLKAKGPEMARSLRDRLDQLLGGKPDQETVFLPGD
ncbi:MAG: hypothetical protein V4754_00415 [Pseudomonadota bacterium]